MFVLIVGGGKVGLNTARQLMRLGHEIVLVEQRPTRYGIIAEELGDEALVFGDGTEVWVLEKAGIGRCDMVVAVTGDDEDNIIISQLAREKYGLENVIARVNDPRNQPIFDRLGVRPTVCAASHLHSLVEHHLPHHRLLSLLDFSEENLRVVELVLTAEAPALGKKVRDLCLPPGLLLAVVFRGREALVPHGDMVLEAGDHLVVILERGREEELSAVGGEC